MHFRGILGIALPVAIDENGVGTELFRRPEWHRRMDTKFPSLIRGRCDYSAFTALPAYYNGFAFKRRIKQLFHGDKKCIHIYVEDGSRECSHGRMGAEHARTLILLFTPRTLALPVIAVRVRKP